MRDIYSYKFFKVFDFEKFKKFNLTIAIHFCLCYTLVSKGANDENLDTYAN